MNVYALTDVGRVRENNQDYCSYTTEPLGNLPNLFLVADGMGGHKAGDFASHFAVDTFQMLIKEYEYTDIVTILTKAMKEVNDMVLKKSAESSDFEGMGTTLVAATIDGNVLKVANVGDSRLYLIGEDMCQITRDHSLVEEMVQRGQIKKSEARTHANKNIITRAIGAGDDVTPEIFTVDIPKDSKILMCTDGLTNMVDDNHIERIVRKGGSVREITEELVTAANKNGGKDNITVMVIDPEAER